MYLRPYYILVQQFLKVLLHHVSLSLSPLKSLVGPISSIRFCTIEIVYLVQGSS